MREPIRAHDIESLSHALQDVRGRTDVRILFFGREGSTASSAALQAANEVAYAGDLPFDISDFDMVQGVAGTLRVRHAPAVALLGPDGDTGIRFYGSLEGFGEAGLVAAVRLAGGADPGLAAPARARLSELAQPERLRLFVNQQHPDTPALVRAVAAVALASPYLRLDVYHAPDFPALARASGAYAVPTLLYGGRRLAPAQDEALVTEEVLRAAAVRG
jgi:hypothetical protein